MSLAALVGLSLGTAAMTIVLGAFDGLEQLVVAQYENTNAPLRMSPQEGTDFALTPADSSFLNGLLRSDPDLRYLPVWKKRVLLASGDHQHICYILGVPPAYHEAHSLPNHLLTQSDPALDLGDKKLDIGSGVAYHLGLSSTNPPPIITAYLPKINAQTNLLNLREALDAERTFVSSIFSLQPDFDVQYALAPASWFSSFIEQPAPSYWEFHTTKVAPLRKALERHFGERAVLANVLEQEATLIKVMRSERTVVLAILTFVVFLASFGVVSALTIIALEKKHDLFILRSMGASTQQLRSIFLKNGLLITASGWAAGIALGSLLILLQQRIGIIPLGTGYVQEFYPVSLSIKHLAFTSVVVLGIGFGLSAWATRRIA